MATRGVADAMPLRAAVELQVQAVTCPGVFLPEKHDVYLSVCILGQHKETECLPPVFPLLFREKMLFEKGKRMSCLALHKKVLTKTLFESTKNIGRRILISSMGHRKAAQNDQVFEHAVDPAAVTEILESLVTKFELIQLTPPAGDGLAFYEENTRDFLFPEPKLTPAYPGVDRELLMKTFSHFPGIAPKIEFSTRTTITDLPLRCKGKNYAPNKARNQRSASASPKQRSKSLTQCKTSVKRDKIQKRPKRSLKSQASNIRDHFCDLPTENPRQLCRPSLRSAEHQLDSENRPPLVVRHVDSSKSFSEITSPLSFCNDVKKNLKSTRESSKFHVKRALAFDNHETSKTSVKIIREPSEQATSEQDLSSFEIDELPSYQQRSPSQEYLAFHCAAPSATSQQLKTPDPARSPSPLQNRCEGRDTGNDDERQRGVEDRKSRLPLSADSSWEKINARVRSLLTSAQAKQRLSSGVTENEIDDVLERRSICLKNSQPNDSGNKATAKKPLSERWDGTVTPGN